MKLVNIKQLIRRPYMAYLMIILAAIIYTTGLQTFVVNANIFMAGVGAISVIPAYVSDNLAGFTTVFYLALNIPLIIIFWKHVKKKFIYKTTFFLILQAAFGSLFFIDELNEFVRDIIIDHTKVRSEIWPIFLFAAIGGIMIGYGISLAWKFGGSTGGSDIIVFYFSTKRKINIGTMSFIISWFFIAFSLIFTTIYSKEIRDNWMITLLATALYVFTSAFVINRRYPKYSKINVEVNTTKCDEIAKFLKKNYRHSFHIVESKSGFTNKNQQSIRSVMLVLEYRDFVREILRIDPKAWIKAEQVVAQVGQFNTAAVDEA